MKSPMSRSLLNTLLYMSLLSSGHMSSRVIYTCIRPFESCISAKDAFPITRRLMRRPAIATSVLSPSVNVSRMSVLKALVGYSAAGYGSIPISRNSCKHCLLTISCSLSSKTFILNTYSYSYLSFACLRNAVS